MAKPGGKKLPNASLISDPKRTRPSFWRRRRVQALPLPTRYCPSHAMFRNPVRASSSSHGEVQINSGTFSSHYPFRLNLYVPPSPSHNPPSKAHIRLTPSLPCNSYNRPPAEDVTLEQFEEFAIARLRSTSPVLLSSAYHTSSKARPL